MKRIISFIFIGVIATTTSCKKYLDINNNPNDATSATAELILPQALTGTANNVSDFNSYGAQLTGYMANAGGYGGFGTAITYNFSSGDFSGRWTTSYDNLEDYQAILNKTDGDATYSYYNAAARIMKALTFQLLVDAYNDVPYTDALQGADNLTPAYTPAATIYKDLGSELDKAIATLNAGQHAAGVVEMKGIDVLFDGDIDKWKQLANTLKLRIMIHSFGKVDLANTSFDPAGFLEEDAMINPGFKRDNGRQNPKWDDWGFSATGSDGNKAWMPNIFVFSFYNGTKLSDEGRGTALYYDFPAGTGTNRLGVESNSLVSSPSGSFWYPSDNRDGKTAGDATGALKGPEAGLPIITAAESYFLQAEGVLKGLITGDDAALFNSGIAASFDYLYQLPDGSYAGDPVADAATYLVDNDASPLVNYSLAATPEQKLEAIITQKYIALNFVNSDEAWNEYRRTHYPTIVNTAGATGIETFASSVSQSTRPDHLPTRILYPTSEGAYNSTNVPKNITPFTSTIFWAQ